MIVCIAEKPSVARDIADVLGARNKKDGYIEGNGYQVTWTFGHLCTLKEPQDYTPQWKSWSLGSLPMIPPRFGIKVISNPTYEHQFAVVEKLMQDSERSEKCLTEGPIIALDMPLRFICQRLSMLIPCADSLKIFYPHAITFLTTEQFVHSLE